MRHTILHIALLVLGALYMAAVLASCALLCAIPVLLCAVGYAVYWLWGQLRPNRETVDQYMDRTHAKTLRQ